MTLRRPSFPVDLKLAIQRRGRTIGMVADEARVPQLALKQFLDGRLDIPDEYLRRLEMWHDGIQVARPRPGVAEDYALAKDPEALAPVRHINMASLGREFETMRKQVDALKAKVAELEARMVEALGRGVMA